MSGSRILSIIAAAALAISSPQALGLINLLPPKWAAGIMTAAGVVLAFNERLLGGASKVTVDQAKQNELEKMNK